MTITKEQAREALANIDRLDESEHVATLRAFIEQSVPNLTPDTNTAEFFTVGMPAEPPAGFVHPMQPLLPDEHGVMRLKKNAIAEHFYEWSQQRGMGLNEIAMMDFTDEDRMQFAQLIGYSLSGYAELSYVSDGSYERAAMLAARPQPQGVLRMLTKEEAVEVVRSCDPGIPLLAGVQRKFFEVNRAALDSRGLRLDGGE